jgi:glutaredoxin 3
MQEKACKPLAATGCYNCKMITIYSTTWCGFCHAAMRYLDQLGVKYNEVDVEKDPAAAREAVEKSGSMGVPVIDVDGTVILGFDKPRLDAALKNKGLI